jgi:hypothetical protein
VGPALRVPEPGGAGQRYAAGHVHVEPQPEEVLRWVDSQRFLEDPESRVPGDIQREQPGRPDRAVGGPVRPERPPAIRARPVSTRADRPATPFMSLTTLITHLPEIPQWVYTLMIAAGGRKSFPPGVRASGPGCRPATGAGTHNEGRRPWPAAMPAGVFALRLPHGLRFLDMDTHRGILEMIMVREVDVRAFAAAHRDGRRR